MIVSHMNYCILAWGYEFNRIAKLLKKKLFVLSVLANIMLIQNLCSKT